MMTRTAPDDGLDGVRHGKGTVAHRYGGQLRKLHDALCDPLQQHTGIVLLGDSITWGLGVPGNGEILPRAHALTDPRDVFETRSWANEFKRAIGREYFSGATALLSNWPGAASGESTLVLRRQVELYPGLPPFHTTLTGTGTASRETACSAARLGYLYQLVDEGGGASQALAFRFTGTAFTLVFTSTAANNPMDYELVVAGVSQGIFSTLDGTRHGVARTHRFGHVRQQQVEIRAVRTAAAGVQYLELEAIRVDKECRITNQGLIGSNVKICLERNCGTMGAPAVRDDDAFVLVQFGTNDRSRIFSKYRQPDCVNNFARNMRTLIGMLQPKADVVLMAAGPVADESADRYAFSMLDVRNALDGLARQSGIDLVDHYAAQQGIDLARILADGLHPNEFGHALIARNLLDALRGA